MPFVTNKHQYGIKKPLYMNENGYMKYLTGVLDDLLKKYPQLCEYFF